MLLVRETFTAKPGNASKLAKLMKRAIPGSRVMTDLVGKYNTVVVEREVESLAAFEKEMDEYRAGKMPAEMAEEMKHYTELYMKGKREIFRIEH